MATQPELVTAHVALILSLASKYVWWKTPEEAVRFIAQVMNIGHHTDVEVMASQGGDAVLIDVLTHAEVGQFTPRSWAYWHYRLVVVMPDEAVPPMPVRVLGAWRGASAGDATCHLLATLTTLRGIIGLSSTTSDERKSAQSGVRWRSVEHDYAAQSVAGTYMTPRT